MDLNSKAYTVAPDNLLGGAAHPLDMRTIEIKNPKCELVRGALIKVSSDGIYFVAGDVSSESEALTGDVMSILGHAVAADSSSETLTVSVYVSGGFNKSGIAGINDYALTDGDILSAQKYGLYIHS